MFWETFTYPRLLVALGCQAKEIHPIPKAKGHVLGICILCDMLVIVLLFCPSLKAFMVKTVFSRYCRKLLVTTPSTEMTKGYADTLLSFQEFLIFRAKVSYFIISSVSVLGNLWVKGTAVSITSDVSFSLSMSTISGKGKVFPLQAWCGPEGG